MARDLSNLLSFPAVSPTVSTENVLVAEFRARDARYRVKSQSSQSDEILFNQDALDLAQVHLVGAPVAELRGPARSVAGNAGIARMLTVEIFWSMRSPRTPERAARPS